MYMELLDFIHRSCALAVITCRSCFPALRSVGSGIAVFAWPRHVQNGNRQLVGAKGGTVKGLRLVRGRTPETRHYSGNCCVGCGMVVNFIWYACVGSLIQRGLVQADSQVTPCGAFHSKDQCPSIFGTGAGDAPGGAGTGTNRRMGVSRGGHMGHSITAALR